MSKLGLRIGASQAIGMALCLALLLLSSPSLLGQNARGTILGHVADPSGAAVLGARVTIKNVNTGVTNEFTTDGTGDFVFVNLIPGTYTVSVEGQGFKTSSSSGLILEVDQTLRQDFTLAMGSLAETVTVSANAQMVQTDNTTIGNVVAGELMQELPLNGRDFTSLLNIDAGATNLGGGSQTYWSLHGLSSFREVSLDGARPDSISYLIDGVTNNANLFSTASSVPSVSAIQEFKVEQGLYSAEYGQGSAQVNVAIKSGTNDYHGSAYDFLQNDAFQPNSPLQAFLNSQPGATPQPLNSPFKQNQFGFTLGGPVIVPKVYHGQNKTFWFFSYEGGRQSTLTGTQSPVQVPTAQERTGNFSDWPVPIYDPSTTGSTTATANDPTGRTPYPNNQIPTSLLNPIASKLLAYYPQPNLTCAMPCNNFVTPVHNSKNIDTETMRVDQNFGSMDRLFFTGIIKGDDEPNPSMLPATGNVSFARSRLFGLTWQHSFGSSIINEARMGFNRLFFHTGVDTAFGADLATQAGLKNSPAIPAFYDIPIVTPNDRYTSIGSGNNGYSQKENDFQYVDNLKIVRGRHKLTFGTDIRRIQLWDQDGFTAMGQLFFTGGYTAANPLAPAMQGSLNILPSGNPFADMFVGYPQSVGAPPPLGSDLFNLRALNYNFFAQDDIRLTPRLTLNLGLRYEIPPNYHSINNSGFAFNPADGGSMVWANKGFVQSVTQQVQAAGGQVNTNWMQCCASNSLVPIDKHDFAPRVGLAWRPFATDRFVIRTGYGIFYDVYERFYDTTQFDDNRLWTLAANPTYPVATGFEKSSPLALSTLWLPPVTSASLFSTATPPYNFGVQVNSPTNHNPYNQQWSFDTEYSLTQSLLLDVGYVGSHGIHSPTQLLIGMGYPPPVAGDHCNTYIDIAQVPAGDPCLKDPNFVPVDKRELWPNFGPGTYYNDNVLNSTYHALQVRVRQRLNNGLQYNLNYTWSKALDETSAINNISGTNDFIMDPHDVQRDYGPASFDQPSRFVASGSYEVPVGKGKRWTFGKANWLVGGWTASGIYTIASGGPFSVYAFPYYSSTDQMGSPFTGRVRANLVANPYTVNQTPLDWYNTSAFAAPAPGTYGDEGKGILRGPYLMDLDMSFAKQFPIKERQKVQYRLDIFNVGSNWHSQFRTPDNDMSDCNYGSLAGCNGAGTLNLWTPRTIQMALIYSF